MLEEIETLIKHQGVLPGEISLLHEQKYVLERYRPLVPKGVQLYEIKRQTGFSACARLSCQVLSESFGAVTREIPVTLSAELPQQDRPEAPGLPGV